jgi:DNA (cytosine-5)-methyltransferase 1
MKSVISLYSGAGGLDFGFKEEGYNIIWANDFDIDACKTYAQNIGEHIRCGDINTFIDELDDYHNKVDVLIGGPPCQGFSVAGKMNPHDERSKNVWTYIDAIRRIMPRVFVMENVKALGTLDKWSLIRSELLKEMRTLGYCSSYVLVNSADFNVPQARERVLFIGFKGNKFLIPDLKRMLEPYMMKAKTVREVLKILDRAGTGNNKSICKAKITLTPNPVMRKSPYAGMLFNGLGRPIKLDGYCSTLPASMGGNKTPIIDEDELYKNKPGWIQEYHSGLIAGNPPSEFKEAPKHLRRITVEEAAILQTFPIDYKFHGSQSSKYKQIGNAVPCNLGMQIAKMLKDYLNSDDSESKIIYLKKDQNDLFEEI